MLCHRGTESAEIKKTGKGIEGKGRFGNVIVLTDVMQELAVHVSGKDVSRRATEKKKQEYLCYCCTTGCGHCY